MKSSRAQIKRLLSYIVILINTEISAQKIVIADSLSGEPLPFAKIQWHSGTIYPDANGSFIYKKNYGKITVSDYGYREKTLIPEKDTIFLSPADNLLPDVILTYHKNAKEIKPLKGNSIWSLGLLKNSRNCMHIIPKEKLRNKKILSFGFKFKVFFLTPNKYRKIRKKLKVLVRYNIYENNNGMPGKKLYESDTIPVSLDTKDIVWTRIDKYITMPDDGLFFCIKSFGVFDAHNHPVEIKKKLKNWEWIYPELSTTSKESDYFKAHTYFNFLLHKNPGKLFPVNAFFNLPHKKHKKKKNYNMIIGITYE